MELTLVNFIIYNFLTGIVYYALMIFIGNMFLERKIAKKYSICFVLFNTLFAGVIGAFLNLNEFMTTHYLSLLMQNYYNFIILFVLICFVLKYPAKRALFTSSAIAFTIEILRLSYVFFYNVFGAAAFDITNPGGLVNYVMLDLIYLPLIVFLFIAFSKKTKLSLALDYLSDRNRKNKGVVFLFVLLPGLFQIILVIFSTFTESNYYVYITLILMMIFIVLISFYNVAKLERSKEEIRANKAIILQQEMYLKNLEKIQQEIRSFKHDYQNMLSGMYLHVEQGHLEELQNFFRRAQITFNRELAEKINQTTQLANIENLSLKSFLIIKLIEIYEKEVSCKLEIITPVKEIEVEDEILNRCLGILIDNAIEAIEGIEKGEMTILISTYNKTTVFIVSNTITEKPNLQLIWKEGYSTKGQNRGVGLVSLMGMVQKYSNIHLSTKIEDNVLIQEMKIQGV